MLYQITEPRLRELDESWGGTFNRSRGPVPRSLGLCHMLAETDGIEQPVTHDLTRRTVGIMRLALRDTLRLGYQETAARDAHTNIYLWCKLANQNAEWLHTKFASWWAIPNLDFWLAVRLLFMLGPTTTGNLFAAVSQMVTERSTAAVLNFLRVATSPTLRFGSYNRTDLLALIAHLDAVLRGMQALDGSNYVATHFSERVQPASSGEALFANTTGYVSQLTPSELNG